MNRKVLFFSSKLLLVRKIPPPSWFLDHTCRYLRVYFWFYAQGLLLVILGDLTWCWGSNLSPLGGSKVFALLLWPLEDVLIKKDL